MATYLYIATAMGLFIATQTDGNWNLVSQPLAEKTITSVTSAEGIILAGTRKGIWRSADSGASWHKADKNLTLRHVRWLSHGSYKTASFFLAGTEPAGIFVSGDGGRTWSSRTEVAQLRDKHGWSLPYSPEAGCVRGFAAARADNDHNRLYAAVEVGGVLTSDDNGRTWQLVEGSDGNPDIYRDLGTMVHPDVHSITVHPSSPGLVTAATGGGLYRSTDGGRIWKNIYQCYIRAVWVDPADPAHIIAGPADGVSRRGRIEASTDGGKTWRPASEGMAPVPWSRHMVDRFYQLENDLFAVLSNGQLWTKPVNGSLWRRILPEILRITAVTGKRG